MEAPSQTNNFDLIRLLAAIQVTYTHASSWLQLPPLPAQVHQAIVSFPGVAVFFGVSGFLISRSYLAPNSNLLRYAANRVLRIYPGLWINIFALVALVAMAGNFLPGFLLSGDFFLWLGKVLVTGSNNAADRLPPAIAYWNNSGAYTYFPSGVLWTLTVELMFYVLVPIIFAKRLVSRNLHFVTLAGAAALSLAAFWHKDLSQGPGYIENYLWIFLVGAAINIAWPAVRRLIVGKAVLWLGLYVALIFWRGTSSYQDATVYAVLMTTLLVISTVSFAFTWRGLSSRIIPDDISYGIYLWHMPIIWTMNVNNWLGGWQFYALAMAVTVAIAAIVRLGAEKPALGLKDSLILRRSTSLVGTSM